MNRIILPEEIVEYIISFTCDKRGYNIELYNKRKKANQLRMKRIKYEIQYFNNIKCSIAWLTPSRNQIQKTSEFKKSLKKGNPVVVYHTGCYTTRLQELQHIPHLS